MGFAVGTISRSKIQRKGKANPVKKQRLEYGAKNKSLKQ